MASLPGSHSPLKQRRRELLCGWTRLWLSVQVVSLISLAAPALSARDIAPESGGGIPLLVYLNSLRGSGKMLSGQHSDHFADADSGTYGKGLDQFTPATGATPANITITDARSGDTGLAPAILGVFLNSAGTCGSVLTLAQGIAIANGQLAANGIVQVTYDQPSPTQTSHRGCNFKGNGTEFPAVITPGTRAYQVYMYGNAGGALGGTGMACTAVAPCGGVWAQAQALKALNGTVLFRTLAEGNLGRGGNWYSTHGTSGGSGGASNANYVTLMRQTIDYLRSLGVRNVLYVYNMNVHSGGYSQNDPGPNYRAVVSIDYYGPTTQSGVLAGMTAGNGFSYANSLGIPFLLSEVGAYSPNNRLVSTLTYDNSIWSQAIQSGASNLVGTIVWNQHWCLQCQLNALGYLQNNITRAQLPPISDAP
jgi:hypothetical protein